MKKLRNDIILIVVLLFLAGLSLILFFTISPKNDLEVSIYLKNNLVYQAQLSGDVFVLDEEAVQVIVDDKEYQEICIEQVDIVIEKDGVFVRSSSCKDHICVNQKKINRAGQSIVCLPNQVSIQLSGKAVDVAT